jgi:hypothetical protein
MSHAKERHEKDCLNCGAMVQGRFCQVCGQENIVPHESFLSMVHHFFADITHFDGLFFKTVGILIAKPGFLSAEYVKGRRNSYLNPVRMYVFTSALFFLIFFSVFNLHNVTFDGKKGRDLVKNGTKELLTEDLKNAKTKEDSADIEKALKGLNDSTQGNDKKNKGLLTFQFVSYDTTYKSVAAYDSIQRSLLPEKRDGWFSRIMMRRNIQLSIHYRENSDQFWTDILEKFLHSLPYLLFVSLPLYALFLKLLYVRRRQFFFADHGIFLVHLYIFTFIFLLLFFGLRQMGNYINDSWMGLVIAAMILFGLIYTLRAMKYFYKQRWVKTILKFTLFNILCIVALLGLFGVFLGISAFRI